MNKTKSFIASYLTGLLSILLVLNLFIVIFSLMGVSWQQIVAFPNFVMDVINDPSKYFTHDSHESKDLTSDDSTSNRQIRHVSGVISDSNIQLVCSDETFAHAAANVRPSIVSISCKQIVPSGDSSGNLIFDDPAPDLQILGGIGSGIIIDSRGYILTCYHVIKNASDIYIIPFGYEEVRYKAIIIAKDENLNLAILKINANKPLPAATIGDSSLIEIADIVLAIGSPFGLEQSVTHGIISDNKRDLLIKGKIYKEMIQTDAPINRGSSGGPLINVNGEIVGINMAIYSSTGVYNGISFALPVNQAKRLIAKYIP